jgi:hypothetical protein
MARLLNEVGVALLVAFVAGAIFLLGQLIYAQLVVMPRLIASGTGVLAVSVGIRPAVLAAGVAFVVYLAWQMRPGRRR